MKPSEMMTVLLDTNLDLTGAGDLTDLVIAPGGGDIHWSRSDNVFSGVPWLRSSPLHRRV